jgi:hypothetical protein
MTALRPGASPPPVEIAIRICEVMMLGYVRFDVPRANASRRRIGPDQELRDCDDYCGERAARNRRTTSPGSAWRPSFDFWKRSVPSFATSKRPPELGTS